MGRAMGREERDGSTDAQNTGPTQHGLGRHHEGDADWPSKRHVVMARMELDGVMT